MMEPYLSQGSIFRMFGLLQVSYKPKFMLSMNSLHIDSSSQRAC